MPEDNWAGCWHLHSFCYCCHCRCGSCITTYFNIMFFLLLAVIFDCWMCIRSPFSTVFFAILPSFHFVFFSTNLFFLLLLFCFTLYNVGFLSIFLLYFFFFFVVFVVVFFYIYIFVFFLHFSASHWLWLAINDVAVCVAISADAVRHFSQLQFSYLKLACM